MGTHGQVVGVSLRELQVRAARVFAMRTKLMYGEVKKDKIKELVDNFSYDIRKDSISKPRFGAMILHLANSLEKGEEV